MNLQPEVLPSCSSAHIHGRGKMPPDSLISSSEMSHRSKHWKMFYKIINHLIKLFWMWQLSKMKEDYFFFPS